MSQEEFVRNRDRPQFVISSIGSPRSEGIPKKRPGTAQHLFTLLEHATPTKEAPMRSLLVSFQAPLRWIDDAIACEAKAPRGSLSSSPSVRPADSSLPSYWGELLLRQVWCLLAVDFVR